MANRCSYDDGVQVQSYLTDPYHRTRHEVAVRLLAEALAHPHSRHLSGPVLEVGCGSRSMLADAGDAGLAVVIADLSLEALRAARDDPSRLWKATRRTVGAVCLDAARPLPFRDESLSAVVMGELIEHLYDPCRLLRDCRRVLQRAGVLVVTTPNLANLQDRLRFLLGRAPRHVDPLHPYLWLHIRPFTASLLERALRSQSFEPIGVRSNYVVWRLRSERWLSSRALARLAPGLGGSLVVAARKLG